MKSILFTQREERLMNFFWKYGKPVTSNEILQLNKEDSWSESYLHVMLRSLQKKGAIEQCGMIQYGKQYSRQFRCIMTKEEYFVRLALEKGIEKKAFAKIAVAMVAENPPDNKRNRQELIQQLEEIVQKLEEEEG